MKKNPVLFVFTLFVCLRFNCGVFAFVSIVENGQEVKRKMGLERAKSWDSNYIVF